MHPRWARPRRYKHLDCPIGPTFAKYASDDALVSRHSWLPLIKYDKQVKRYKPVLGKTTTKVRPIMYPSHRDAGILAKYADDLNGLLEALYVSKGLSSSVVAYRKLGLTNYDFAVRARDFAVRSQPCVVLCFDIEKFFDTLSHRLLKDRLRRVLAAPELPPHWYRVFRHVTRYSMISKDDLVAHPIFGARIASRKHVQVGTITEIKTAGIPISTNKNDFGIPQGTPISSVLSNLYMLDVDELMIEACSSTEHALYLRYSDDILLVCVEKDEMRLTDLLVKAISDHCLKLNTGKTVRTNFVAGSAACFQYLGFNIAAKRSIRNARNAALARGAARVFTKRLRKRFSPVGARNFSAYARRSANAFDDKGIVRQVRRWERRRTTQSTS